MRLKEDLSDSSDFVRFAGLLDLSVLSDQSEFTISEFQKNRATDGRTDRRTDGRI